jgi:hypothetical protein
MVIRYFQNEDFKKSSCLNRLSWKLVDFSKKAKILVSKNDNNMLSKQWIK